MIVIGLTGPTGAGKGLLGQHWQQQGALFIDTDRVAREVVQAGSPALNALVAAFGEEILDENGALDRRCMAAKVFTDKDAKDTLERITHPAIYRRCEELIAASDAPMAVLDAPLLFESGCDRLCDVTLAVLSSPQTRLQRITARDGLDEARALMRMNAQPPDTFYRDRATHTLMNDGDPEELCRAADAWLTAVKEGSV